MSPLSYTHVHTHTCTYTHTHTHIHTHTHTHTHMHTPHVKCTSTHTHTLSTYKLTHIDISGAAIHQLLSSNAKGNSEVRELLRTSSLDTAKKFDNDCRYIMMQNT